MSPGHDRDALRDDRSDVRSEDRRGGREQELLEERARALARPARDDGRQDELTLVGFALGGEAWAVEARFVWEAFRLHQLTPLPGGKAPHAGVCGWRGSVLLVLDLRSLLGVPVAPLADLAHVVVLGEQRPSFGILADALGGVARLEHAALTEPGAGAAIHREWILGVTPSSNFVLDAAKLLKAYG
jgi:chemotaxis signal transduction protein